MFSNRLRIPLSTYRLQFNYQFTFTQAARLVPYLHALGITDCYASPYLKAVPGSLHGYDIVDPTSLNPEIGSPEEYQAFVDALRAYEMGQILDVVPNHMGIANSANPWWQDVLENGPSSRYASYFDIDWTPAKPELENKVLLPILGDQYGIVLENQEIVLCYEEGVFFLRYYTNRLPLDPKTWLLILSFRQDELSQQLEETDASLLEYQSIMTAISNLPSRTERDQDRIAVRYREKEVIRRRLATLTQDSPFIAQFLAESIRMLNGTRGVRRSFDLLDALVSDQAYRLAYWRVASEEINYRRFFDINELAAIRMEHPGVFEDVHQLVFRMLQQGAVTGLRIDHVDGLYDPRDYLHKWQAWAQEHLPVSPDDRGRAVFLVVEKILGKNEPLCEDWPIHGTTGYDFLALVNNVFIHTEHQQAFDKLFARFTKEPMDLDELLYRCKRLIMSSSMSSEINALGHRLDQLSERDRRTRDFTLNSLIHAIREIIAGFPVYRTYVTPDPQEAVMDRDRLYIRLAVARAKRRNPTLSNLVFDFIRTLLLKEFSDEAGWDWENACPFVMKFQQTTSPVTAKGVEDTACYVYNRFLSVNEVGSELEQFGLDLDTFHHRMEERCARWPHSLSTTSTHDTKRSEDVRARLNVLSELPKEWARCISRWHRLNRRARTLIEDRHVPDPNEEYLLYQTLIGAWPFEDLDDQAYAAFVDRIQQYMNKALREAKRHTSWLNPHIDYEHGVQTFIAKILDRTRPNPFLQEFLPFQRKIAGYGIYNSLSQLLIKVTAPGIPDFYQGAELWDFHLVDPDNRQPVDFAVRHTLLAELQRQSTHHSRLAFLRTLLEQPADGRIKLFVTWSSLQFRKSHAEAFLNGTYQALEAHGDRKFHVCAFARIHESCTAVTIVPRFVTGLIPSPLTLPLGKDTWRDTWVSVPAERVNVEYRNVFSDEIYRTTDRNGIPSLPMEEVCQHFPLALLERMP
ncbi:MAG: malto-oligosyltrehalose synthase [Nitrospirae bacterium]|nr:MAG: malto-oligosyltrehalose synthase [Nitrospirota bacterium]